MSLPSTQMDRPNAISLFLYKFSNNPEIGMSKEQYFNNVVSTKISKTEIPQLTSKNDFFINDIDGFINKIIDDIKARRI